MKIAIVTGFSGAHAAGLEQFLGGLLKGLETVCPKDTTISIYTGKGNNFEAFLTEHGVKNMRVEHLPFGVWWKQFGLFFAPRADVYLFNGLTAPFFFRPKRSFVIAYDFAYRHYVGAGFGARLRVALMDVAARVAARRATRIISISEATKKELCELFNIAPQKVSVVYPGVKDLSHVVEEPIEIPKEGYFLFVGTTKERKNVLDLIRGCIKAAQEKNLTEQLLIVGRNNPDSSYGKLIERTIADSGLASRIQFLGRVSEGQLRFLYRHAVAFAFPSAYEGFGMPVVEAMREGVPVLTSNTSSLPEAAGDAAYMVPPHDVEAIANALATLAGNPEKRAELIRKGLIQGTKFSWESSAKTLLAVLSSS